MKVGFAGSGNMAAAIARGWRGSGRGPELMLFTDAGSGRAAALAEETGGRLSAGLAELASDSDAILLAVKPSKLEEVAPPLAASGKPIISVLGATSLATLAAAFPSSAVLRTMPNVGVELGRGVICHAEPGDHSEELAPVLELLGVLGRLVELPEDQLDAATAIMGCSLAYFALAAEALVEAGVEAGVDPETAGPLVAGAVAGTGELLERHSPAAIRVAVASPGGSTEAGLAALERGGAPAAFSAAVDDSLKRMRGEM